MLRIMKKVIQSIQTISTSPDDTKQTSKTNFKLIITRSIVVIFITVAAIGGWQIHNHLAQKNDNQSPPTYSPTSLPTSSPTHYAELFLGPSLSKDTLYNRFDQWANQISQMEKDIKHFMDQKRAVIRSFENRRCQYDWEWYQHIENLKEPTIDFNQTTNSIKLNVEPLCPEWQQVCKATNGTLTHIDIENRLCFGTVNLTSLPSSLEVFKLYMVFHHPNQIDLTSLPQTLQLLSLNLNSLTGTVDLTSLPQSLHTLSLYGNKFTGTVDFTKLPANLKDIQLHGSFFDAYIGLEEAKKNRKILHFPIRRKH